MCSTWTSGLNRRFPGCRKSAVRRHVAAQHAEYEEPDASVLPVSGSFCMREALGIDARCLAMLVGGASRGWRSRARTGSRRHSIGDVVSGCGEVASFGAEPYTNTDATAFETYVNQPELLRLV